MHSSLIKITVRNSFHHSNSLDVTHRDHIPERRFVNRIYGHIVFAVDVSFFCRPLNCDRIFADPLTITGSIGIFGLIPNVKGLSDKLGINPQSVSTNPAADFPTLFTPMDEKQLSIMQKYVETGYDRFIKRVATGRKMTEAKVRQIAEGRVWNAMKAKEIGLVDELGSLKDAIEWTAKKADIYSKYDVPFTLGISPKMPIEPVIVKGSAKIRSAPHEIQ